MFRGCFKKNYPVTFMCAGWHSFTILKLLEKEKTLKPLILRFQSFL